MAILASAGLIDVFDHLVGLFYPFDLLEHSGLRVRFLFQIRAATVLTLIGVVMLSLIDLLGREIISFVAGCPGCAPILRFLVPE